jgi:hypothetical protein
MATSDTLEHTGEHQQRFRGAEEMATQERNRSVRGQVEDFARDFSGRMIEIVAHLGGSEGMAAYPHNGVKKVESMYAYGVIKGVKGHLNRLSDAFIAMMFSPLSKGVAGLGGITSVSPSTLRRLLVEGKDLSEEVLTSIEAFVTGWRAVLGAPRFLFAGGTPGICGRPRCLSQSVTVVGYSHPSFTSGQCVAHEEVITAVCDEHDRAFFGKPPPTKYQPCKAENVTLKTQVDTLEARVDTLEAEKRSLEGVVRALATQVVTLKEEKRSVEAEKRFVEEAARSLEGQVATDLATLTTDLATSRARVAELEEEMGDEEEQFYKQMVLFEELNEELNEGFLEQLKEWQATRDATQQVARLVGLVAAEREATREAEVQTQYFVELERTHREETQRVLEEIGTWR